MSAGENIKNLREKNGFAQAELSRMTGIDEKYISAIERGARNPGKRIMEKLCDAFGVDEQTIRYGERKEKEKPQMPEHLRLLHAEIDRVIMGGKSVAEQYDIASKILKLLQEDR